MTCEYERGVEMKWAELSRDVQNILEFLEGPYTDKFYILSIKVGEMLKLDDRVSGSHPNVVTKEQFDEICSWVKEEKDKLPRLVVKEDDGFLKIGFEKAWKEIPSTTSDVESNWEADGPTFFR